MLQDRWVVPGIAAAMAVEIRCEKAVFTGEMFVCFAPLRTRTATRMQQHKWTAMMAVSVMYGCALILEFWHLVFRLSSPTGMLDYLAG
jgi:hypothetical protein